MTLKEFVKKNDITLLEKMRRCRTLKEFEAFAEENGIKPDAEEMEKISALLQTELLHDDDLANVAGGFWQDWTCPKMYVPFFCESANLFMGCANFRIMDFGGGTVLKSCTLHGWEFEANKY